MRITNAVVVCKACQSQVAKVHIISQLEFLFDVICGSCYQKELEAQDAEIEKTVIDGCLDQINLNKKFEIFALENKL